MDKMNINCTNGEVTSGSFTPDEITQMNYEKSLPIPILPPSLQEQVTANSNAISFLMGV